MVRIEEPDDYAKLDEMVHRLAEKHGLKLDVSGWTRKTYDFYIAPRGVGGMVHLARVESFATTSGEIHLFHADGMDLARDLGEEMEKAFAFDESVIIKEDPPGRGI